MEEELEETSLRHRSGASRHHHHHHHHQRRRAKKPPPPSTTNYDDVFGGPPRHAVPFSGVPDDYAEVFGGVTASCSIPFLDLPMAHMDGWDCASGESVNGVDYGEIFGRCDFADFAVPYEELFGRGRRDEGDINMHFVSSNGRSSVKGRSGPQTIDPSEFIQEFSNEDSIPYLEDGNFSVISDEIPKEYNTSYSKSSRTQAKELLHNTASVPLPQTGFTFVVDADKSLPGNLPFINEDTVTHENSMKQNPASAANSRSISREEPMSCEVPSMGVSDINLQTQSSNLPPLARPAPPKFLINDRQKINTSAKTDSAANFSIGAEQPQLCQQEKPKPFVKSDSLPLNFDFVPSLKLDKRDKPKLKKPITFSKSESLPPGFGSELDAMKEAMEFAQARLKTAKELHEQRREGKITELPLKKRHVKEECLEGSEGQKPVFRSVSLASNYNKGREFTKVQGCETMATHGVHELEKSGKWISGEEFHELTSIGPTKEREIKVGITEIEPLMEANRASAMPTKEREIKVGITGIEPLMEANRESVKIYGMPPTELGGTENLDEDVKETENIEVVREIKFGEDLKREENITIATFEISNGNQESTIEQAPAIIQDELKLGKERGEDKTEALIDDANGIQNVDEIENTGVVEAETGDGKGFQMKVRTETEDKDLERNEVELELEIEKLQKSEEETIRERMRGELDKEGQREKEIKEEDEKERAFQLEEDKKRALKLEEQKEIARKLEEEEELRLLMEKEREEKERMEREKMLAEEREKLERERKKFEEELDRERLIKEEREEKQRKLAEEREREREIEEEKQEEKMREKEMMRKLEEEKERERKLAEEIEKERERVRKLEQERELERQRVRKLEEEKEREREMARKLEEEKERERKLEEEIKKERERVRKLEEERELERERVRKLEEERELERERFRKLEEEREQERERVRKLEEEREKAIIEKEMERKERERIEKEREQKEREKKLEEERIEKEREQKEREKKLEEERIEKEREQEEREKKLEEEKERQRMMEKEKEEREKLRRMEKEREEKEMAMRLETEMRRIERERAEEKERMTKLQGERAKESKTEARKSDEEREREKRMKERERRAESRKSDEEREKAQGRKSDEERERERERRARKERDVEREREREKEEREREREKDRLAMEQATKERAERIALERITAARLRAVESREKEEINNRSGAEGFEKKRQKGEEDKKEREGERNAREARMRVERAAVERATAEARERAIERAKAEAEKERDRLERFKSLNKISSQDHPQEVHFKRTQSDSALSQGESALRHKARLERQQRTAERAAKALAEKNRRDIMAQREQAERDRISDHLDADVKRWSSGKEGNLRALLSTLQYILGQNSGWQPIHLTEVITATDVKKAYRKATLYVHPDKLQQRGASIQQKYICEKVFDLLKEAWNKFNSEER